MRAVILRFPPSHVAPGREGRFPGLGPGRDEFPSASRPRDGGEAEGPEDGQPDLHHLKGNHAGHRTAGVTALFKTLLFPQNEADS